ncbi:MAG TPA: antibiotic biosynthesis monooxygenase [Thermoplasmataceae archaeon]|nr:antibiotic biosynthesis monooxygenase [Thermoplasmatales archaeon AK]HLH86473.1 antibiotic biosynthesis monooxygenase [Thermoplasmataceae archaeon]
MINVGFFYSVVSGKEEEFEETFKGVIKFLRENDTGIREVRLYRDVLNAGEYMIFSEWDSVESFREFISSRPFKETTEHGKNILRGKPRHIILKAEEP